MQENLMLVKEERLFLLRKLCQQQGEMESNSTNLVRLHTSNANSPSLNSDCNTPKKIIKKRTTDGPGISLYSKFCCKNYPIFPTKI